jgi:hypothetical protein
VARVTQDLPDKWRYRERTRRPVYRVIFQLDGKGFSGDLLDRTSVKKPRDRCGIERSRHHQNHQVGTYRAPDLSEERQRKVAVQASFVELVEYNSADILEEGVGQELTGQDSLGLNPHPGSPRNSSLEPDLVANFRTQRPTLLEGDPGRRRPRCDPAWLEQDHAGMVARQEA